MNKVKLATMIAITIPAVLPHMTPHTAMAETTRPSNMQRSAFLPHTTLKRGETVNLMGSSDLDQVLVKLSLDDDGKISDISLVEGRRILRAPDESWSMMSGAQQASLAKLGSMTTLVINGKDEAGDWHLALKFHSAQLRTSKLTRPSEKRQALAF